MPLALGTPTYSNIGCFFRGFSSSFFISLRGSALDLFGSAPGSHTDSDGRVLSCRPTGKV